MTTRDDCLGRDAADPLAALRARFALPDGVVYLDGNSLGALPVATVARVRDVVADEWGVGLIGSWNSAGWMDLPRRVGDKIARLVGAGPGELTVADSTSVNLYKVLHAALDLARAGAPQRTAILTERGNFPTDLYIADSVARARGCELRVAGGDRLAAHLDDHVAVQLLTHVDYRTGRVHRMDARNIAAHAAGALAVWDLSHSAGALPVNLAGSGPLVEAADFAVGCGYKYLNGGPGAPAFVWAHPRHVARMDALGVRQPLSGWLSHAAPFAFADDYHPAAGIARFGCGTPPVLSLVALECGVDTVLAAEPLGGIEALRAKSLALTDLLIALVDERCAGHGLVLQTPRDPRRRGSQVSLAHPEGGYAIVQALLARGVVGDFRAPDLVRFGIAPLYVRHVDVWDAVEALRQVLVSGEWRDPRYARRAAVT
ncbi:MAG: kynureninase [Burkholderiales bacterium]